MPRPRTCNASWLGFPDGIRALQQRVCTAAIQRRRAPAHHGRGRDRAGRRSCRLQVHVGDRAPLPHRVLAPVGQRGVPRLPRRRDRQHPPRVRHLQHHAAREPPGAHRRAGRAARPLVGRSLRVRDGPRLVDDRAEGIRHFRSRCHQGDVRRGGRRVRQDVAHRRIRRPRRAVLLDAAAQRAAQAVREAAPADVGRGRQSRNVREGRAHGARRAVLHDRRGRNDQAARRALQARDRERGARRRVRERQRDGHDATALPRRRRSRANARHRSRDGVSPQPAVAIPRHLPAAGGRAGVARGAPGPDLRADRRRDCAR